MASLSDENIQNEFVSNCVELSKKWQGYDPKKRKKKLRDCINSTLVNCDIPEITMKQGGSPVFLPEKWDIRTPDNLTSQAGTEVFARVASLIYHEARHAEQFFRIAQGLFEGALKLPASAGLTNKKITSKDVQVNTKIKSDALLFAEAYSSDYPSKMHAEINRWYQSIYGEGRQHRGEVLAHLNMDFYHNERPDLTFKKYLVLPEEKDAYLVQDQVLVRLADQLNLWA